MDYTSLQLHFSTAAITVYVQVNTLESLSKLLAPLMTTGSNKTETMLASLTLVLTLCQRDLIFFAQKYVCQPF